MSSKFVSMSSNVVSMSLDIADLPLVGGHPALDLVNSIERGDAAPGQAAHDFLTDPAALRIWAARVGLLDGPTAATIDRAWRASPETASAALHGAREIREALHSLLLTSIGERASDADVINSATQTIHRQWVSSARRSRLIVTADEPAPGRIQFGSEPERLLPDRLIEAVIDAISTLTRDRLRRCPTESGGCGWMFLDQTRNGSRRWCRMADCGTRVKTDRLTERRRALRVAERPRVDPAPDL